jgi:hypothetical protein
MSAATDVYKLDCHLCEHTVMVLPTDVVTHSRRVVPHSRSIGLRKLNAGRRLGRRHSDELS